MTSLYNPCRKETVKDHISPTKGILVHRVPRSWHTECAFAV